MNKSARVAMMANISKALTDMQLAEGKGILIDGFMHAPNVPTFHKGGKRISNRELRVMARNMGVSLKKTEADALMEKD